MYTYYDGYTSMPPVNFKHFWHQYDNIYTVFTFIFSIYAGYWRIADCGVSIPSMEALNSRSVNFNNWLKRESVINKQSYQQHGSYWTGQHNKRHMLVCLERFTQLTATSSNQGDPVNYYPLIQLQFYSMTADSPPTSWPKY
jgi:hypothetical protein